MQPELKPIDDRVNSGLMESGVASLQHRVLRNTYWLLSLSLIPTVIGAALGTNLDLSFMQTSPMISMFAVLGIFYGWIYAIEKNRDRVLGVGLLLGFTMFLGLLLGPLLQRVLGLSNGIELVMMAAGGTAAVFFVMAAIGSSTQRDFSGLGNFLMVGGIVIMLAMIANAFFASPALHLVVLAGFVLFSTLMMLYQINVIVRGGETNYVSATLTLYISIYNLFSVLLQFLGIGNSSD